MIRLHPLPQAAFDCPHCGDKLNVIGWYIPGMRTLADLRCEQCGRTFYGDLPAGHGLYYPVLLDQASGEVHDIHNAGWFAGWLQTSYAHRASMPITLSVEEVRPINRPLLLNCLDRLYGHSLLKLLNAQYYLDHCPDFDLIVLVPRVLRWMIPDGVAAIWTADLSLEQGILWNDWLADEIKRRFAPFEAGWLSVAFSHPDTADYAIERFTRVMPFNRDHWTGNVQTPVITYIWRGDRAWDLPAGWALSGKIARRLGRGKDGQTKRVVALAETVRQALPGVDFAVVGLGTPGGMPGWIADWRTTTLDNTLERTWCERYARSHIVIGVHGSNMLLPSAHAGSVIELVPTDRWGNRYQDIVLNETDMRLALCRYTLLPVNSSPPTVAQVAGSILKKFPIMRLNFERGWLSHQAIQADPFRIQTSRHALLNPTPDLSKSKR